MKTKKIKNPDMRMMKVGENQTLVTKDFFATVRCSNCELPLFKDFMPNGKLKFVDNKPCCVRCFVLRTPIAEEVLKAKSDYEKDVDEKEEHEQKRANDIALELAYRSQQNFN